jgi:hypothetical protein
MQLIKLFTTTSTATPRINTITPTSVSVGAGGAGATAITIKGSNLKNATVQLRQGSLVLDSTDSLNNGDSKIIRQFNMSGQPTGAYEVLVTNGGVLVIQTGLPPGTLGGINAIP